MEPFKILKNIEKAKILLKKSLEKISNDQEYSNIKFHLELYRARQLWKIRKIGDKFSCDLSYRSGIKIKSKFII